MWDPNCLYVPDRIEPQLNHFWFPVAERKHNQRVPSYQHLHAWSCLHYEKFWREVWHFVKIKASRKYDKVIDTRLKISDVPEWFHGARLNYAENILRREDTKVAMYFYREGLNMDTDVQEMSFRDLKESVTQYAAALRAAGVKSGDQVSGYMPNCCECIVAMLATAAVGAVWSSCSPDFGHVGVLERFKQVQPKVLFSVEAVMYNGKRWDHMEKLRKVVEELACVESVVLVPYLGVESQIDISTIPNCEFAQEFLRKGQQVNGSFPPLVYEQVPFNHPLFVMFSSGTTGEPKCMVHSVGGTLIKHLEEHIMQADMCDRDVMLFWTTTGWMMWNWMVSALATGCTLVLYDGSPFEPNVHVLWDLVDKLKITILGMGAKCYEMYEEKQLRPMKSHDLRTLAMLLSTGSPLKPSVFDYIYKRVKQQVLVGSIAGGTEILGCFMGVTWAQPVYRGECQALYLGMDCEVWNEKGEKLTTGEKGELVCKTPFPSMPTHFLNDADGAKYRRAYFDKFDGVWAHADFCQMNPDTGGVVMLGRSDGTLNPGGVRFGSAEIYHVVEQVAEVDDCVCVGQRLADGDERVVLFVKLRDGVGFTDELAERIKQGIRRNLSPKHVPAIILSVADVPYTANGKKVEVAVRKIVAGEAVDNLSALRNPDALKYFENRQELVVA